MDLNWSWIKVNCASASLKSEKSSNYEKNNDKWACFCDPNFWLGEKKESKVDFFKRSLFLEQNFLCRMHDGVLKLDWFVFRAAVVAQQFFSPSFSFLPLSWSWSFNLSCPCRLASRLELGSQVGLTTDHLSSCCLIQHIENLSTLRAEPAWSNCK